MIVRSKAPHRISFGGGGTDMAPYCTDYGGCVISTTIDKSVHITIKPRTDKINRIISINKDDQIKFHVGDKNYSGDFALIKAILNVLTIDEGFNIVVYSDLPEGSGMGGSSSLTVAVIGAFDKFYNLGLSKYDIAQKSYEIERIELNQKGGYQDQFAASFGGFNFIKFSNNVKIFPIDTSRDIINELQYRLILCYVGGSHFSSDIQDEVLKGYKYEKKLYLEVMQDLKNVAYSMKDIFESKDITRLNQFGELLHKGWLAKKSLSSKISTNEIEKFYLISRKHGVLGGKLLGAGGGGHLLLFCESGKKFKIIQELEKVGGKIINFNFNPNGLEAWKTV